METAEIYFVLVDGRWTGPYSFEEARKLVLTTNTVYPGAASMYSLTAHSVD